ncbi:MAG: M48 family metallopeptidase [Gammaproteobacteria bacterium]|nr:M48 family metallopeptidase [Gammaproteobacteria bacterium]
MHPFSIIFLVFLGAMTITQLWLATRQIRHVSALRGEVPPAFADKVTLQQHHKAADYTVAGTRLGIVDTVLDAVWLLVLTLGGVIGLIDQYWRGLELPWLTTGIAVVLSVFLLSWLVSLPLSVYKTFGLEARFEFNRTTPALFVADALKGLLIGAILGAPLLAAIIWLMQNAGELWWLYAWGVWAGFSLLLFWAYPAFIAPLFNKFSALKDETLRGRIEALLKRCGFKSNGIFVMDGSKRSAHGNAYFTGLGNNKRIVFFDTLMESLEGDEIEAVLAHELGHFRMHHIRKRMLVSFAMALAGLALLGWLSAQSWFYAALGVDTPSVWIALLLFVLVTPVFTFPLTPLTSLWSRRHEFEADEYAAEQSDANQLAHALVKLYQDNATTLTPDPVHSRFYDSHPPAPVRIARLRQLTA